MKASLASRAMLSLSALFALAAVGSAQDELQAYAYTWSTPDFTVPIPGQLPGGESWEVDQGSTLIASSNSPQGWNGRAYQGLGAMIQVYPGVSGPMQGLTLKVSASPGYFYSLSFDVIPDSTYLATAQCLPGWAETESPKFGSSSGGQGPSAYDYTDTATGVQVHAPPPDLTAYNANGPSAEYQRLYRSSLAYNKLSAPGLSFGWVDNYSYGFSAQSPGTWGKMILTHPDGAQEIFTPVMKGQGTRSQLVSGGGGGPTGAFTGPPGTPYTVAGTPSGTTGDWTSVTVYFKNLSSWTFYPETRNANSYHLDRISNGSTNGGATAGVGRYISMNRDSGNSYRINSVMDDAGDTQLSFVYSGAFLQSIQDLPGQREVDYQFLTEADTTCLTAVSQAYATPGNSPGDRFEYAYQHIGGTPDGAPFLTSVTTPDMAEAGMVSNQIQYVGGVGTVATHSDAHGTPTSYTYGGSSTAVAVGPWGSRQQSDSFSYTQNFQGDLNVGCTDSLGHSSSIAYGDANNPFRPTALTNRNGETYRISYDPGSTAGNVLTTTDLRGAVTTYTNTYSQSTPYAPNGLVTQVSPAGRTSTEYVYYASTANGGIPGYLFQVLTPAPGTANSGQRVISREYTYTALGDVSTVKVLDQHGNQQTYTLGYGTPERLGEPTSLTDPLSHKIQYGYDAEGRLSGVTDANGNTTQYFYNAAGQLTKIVYPLVKGPSPAYTLINYPFVGGSPISVVDYDESGIVCRTRGAAYGTEGELQGVPSGGNLMPEALGLDGLYRPITDSDGNNSNGLTFDGPPGAEVGNLSSISSTGTNGAAYTSYDSDGNLTGYTNGRDQSATLTLAPDDSRVTAVNYSPSGRSVSYGFDIFDRITSIADQTGTTQYHYDDLDNLTEVDYSYSVTVNGSQHDISAKVNYTYNPDGSRATMTLTPSGGTGWTYNYDSYDAVGRLTGFKPPWVSSDIVYSYQPNSWIQEQNAGLLDTHVFENGRGWPNDIRVQDKEPYGPSNIEFNAFKWDGVGNVLNYSLSVGADGSIPDMGGTMTIAYDGLLRPFSQSYSNPNGFAVDPQFTRDSSGNMIQRQDGANTYNFPVGAGDEITGSGFSYDGDGLPEQFDGTSVTFDEDNKQTSVGSSIPTEAERGDGLRGFKEDSQGNLDFFIYDGDQVLCELNSSGAIYAAYAYGPYGLVQRWDSGIQGYYEFAYDPFGSPFLRQSDLSSTPRDQSLYDLAGGLWYDNLVSNNSTAPAVDPVGGFGQWGAWTDEQLRSLPHGGFTIANGRYYDPQTGRFMDRSDLYPNPYVDVDNGAAMLTFFHAAEFVPVIGSSFFLAEGSYELSAGNYLQGGFDVVGGASGASGLDVLDDLAKVAPSAGSSGEAMMQAVEAPQVLASGETEIAGQAVVPEEETLAVTRLAGQPYREARRYSGSLGGQAHHIIEARFAKVLKLRPNDMFSVILSREEHQQFTNAWRSELEYGKKWDADQIERAARNVYRDYPEPLEIALRQMGRVP